MSNHKKIALAFTYLSWGAVVAGLVCYCCWPDCHWPALGVLFLLGGAFSSWLHVDAAEVAAPKPPGAPGLTLTPGPEDEELSEDYEDYYR